MSKSATPQERTPVDIKPVMATTSVTPAAGVTSPMGAKSKMKGKKASDKHSEDAVDELASDKEDSAEGSGKDKENTPSSSRRKNASPQTRQGTKRRKVDSPQNSKESPRAIAANPATRSSLSVNVPAPVGFLAGRESRAAARGKGDRPIGAEAPSPVVMGFDIGNADAQQIQTVRNTLLLKQQQEALIAQRRRDGLTTPVTATGELGWPNWKEQEEEARAKRQAQLRRENEKLSIIPASYNTSGVERDVGSKSAPLNHPSMAQQQRTPRESHQHNLPQTSHPSSSRHNQDGPSQASVERPPRTAHPSTSNMQHQQQQADYAWEQRQREKERDRERDPRDHQQPLLTHRPASTGQHDRRIVSVPSLGTRNGSGLPPGQYHLPEPNVHNGGPPSGRQTFLAPFAQLYDTMTDNRHLRGQMLELLNRGEEHLIRQDKVAIDMADHYRRSVHLLNTLQESSISLQDMVKREVAVVRADYEEEIGTWRRRYEDLSKRLEALEK